MVSESDGHIFEVMHPRPGMPSSPVLVSAHKIAIAGLGLIGGSLARRLVERGRYVVGWNHTPRPYAAARAAGIRCVATLAELTAGKPDVLVIAVPLVAIPRLLAELKPVLRPVTTLTDVGSVKAPVRRQVREAGLGDCYVGAHPMTGTEHSGFEASDPRLFADALWALTVDRSTAYNRFLTVADMVTQGMGDRMIVVDDATHDAAAALISHMPHVVATALASMLVDSHDRAIASALAAGSWRDMTRVALTDPRKTQAMVQENALNVAALLRRMAVALTGVAGSLDGSESGVDDRSLTAFFDHPDPYRHAKLAGDEAAGETDRRPQRRLRVGSERWQRQLLESARRGEQITAWLTTSEALVKLPPDLASAESHSGSSR